jgi:hypothetical protein
MIAPLIDELAVEYAGKIKAVSYVPFSCYCALFWRTTLGPTALLCARRFELRACVQLRSRHLRAAVPHCSPRNSLCSVHDFEHISVFFASCRILTRAARVR